MKQSTEEKVGLALDIETELTDEIQYQIERMEHIRERINPGPLSDGEIVCALMLGGYDPMARIEEQKSDEEIRAEDTIAQITGKRRRGRPPNRIPVEVT